MNPFGEEEVDLDKARRNLLIASTILIVIAITGANIRGASLPGLSVTFSKPDAIIYFVYMAFVYENWRFLVFTSGTKYWIREPSSIYMNKSKIIKKFVKRFTNPETAEWGINDSQNFSVSVPHQFRRKIIYYTRDAMGAYSISHETTVFLHEIFIQESIACLKYLAIRKNSVEYIFPIVYSLIALFITIFHKLG